MSDKTSISYFKNVKHVSLLSSLTTNSVSIYQQTFPANFDRNTAVTSKFSKPVYARVVRIYCLNSNDYNGASTYWQIRFELLGCLQESN